MDSFDRKIKNALYQLVQVDKLCSQIEVSKKTGVAQSTVSAVMNGTRRFPPKKREALFNFFGMTEEEFLAYPQKRAKELSFTEDQQEAPAPETVEIKYFPDVYASAGEGIVNYDESVSAMTFDKAFLTAQFGIRNFGKIHIINAVGNSMKGGEDPINPGDLLFINPADKELISGGVFCVWINGRIMVKRIAFDPTTNIVKLLSDNKEYDPIIINDCSEHDVFKVIGQVIGVFKKM